jgi:integrase
MTSEIGSRAMNLADVIAAVKSAKLPRRDRDDMASAVRTVARILNSAPEHIPAEPRLLAMRLDKVTPQAAAMSPGRLANIRSLLRRAMALHRPVMPGRLSVALLPDWSVLYARLPSRAHQVRLSRLLRWLSEQGVSPGCVTLEHLETFKQQLQNDSLMTKAEGAWRDSAWAWNSARKCNPDWPALEIHVASRQIRYTFDWDAFPANLKADADAYLDRLSGKDLLGPAPPRPVRESTRNTRGRQIRTFASALVHQGVPAASLQTLADLVSPDKFKLGLRYFLGRRGDNGTSSTIAELAMALKAVARHWVNVSAEASATIDDLVRRVSVEKRRGMTTKNRTRLRAFDDQDNVDELLNLPQKLLGVARSGKYSKWRSAILAQSAAAIELLLMRPLRLDNLRTLDLDQNFILPSRAGGTMHIIIRAAQVKNAIDLEHALPAESVHLLKTYLHDYRPALCEPQNRKLFPAATGESDCKSIGALRTQIKRAALRYAGLEINPHLFRHIAAKLHLDRHPGEYAVIQEVLAHKSLATTRNSYTGLETDAAVRHFDSTIIKIRERTTQRSRGGSSRAPRSSGFMAGR